MIKSDDRRLAILGRLADYMLSHGLSASSLRPLAKAAHISDRMLLYYFKDKAEIVTATLEIIAQRLVIMLNKHTADLPLPLDILRANLSTVLLSEELWPYMCLWLEIASISARGDPLTRAIGEGIGRSFLAWGAEQLACATPEALEIDAAKLLVSIEGMVLLKSIGLEDVCKKAV